jgi:alpha-L-fucosidase
MKRRGFIGTGLSIAAGVMLPPDSGTGILRGAGSRSIRSGKSGGPITGPAAVARRAQTTLPLPTPAQLEWQRDELAMFLHFGVNTFTDREWGDGSDDPSVFVPARLDARQWARAARTAGFRAMILTAKHHDGFCLWPSRTTSYTVAASPWRGGSGDVVREFVDACRAETLRPGLYLSPWDRNHPAYGDSNRYNDVYIEQLTELLTSYGPLAEVWFDGANGEGPDGRRQRYDWPRVFGTVRSLQPDAVIFSDAGPDVRWCGNEAGTAGEPCWSMVRPAVVPEPGVFSDEIRAHLQHGEADGTVWRPAEADTSIRPGWFYHAAEDDRVRSVDELVDLYFTSVGRNSKLLLNVPPTRDGLLHDTDIGRLSAFRHDLDTRFASDLAATAKSGWRRTGSGSAELSLEFDRPVRIACARLAEDIESGQRVAEYALLGSDGIAWETLSRGTTIGYAKIDRFRAEAVTAVRLVVTDAIGEPLPIRLQVFAQPGAG